MVVTSMEDGWMYQGKMLYLTHFRWPFIFSKNPACKVTCKKHAAWANHEDKYNNRRCLYSNIQHKEECKKCKCIIHTPVYIEKNFYKLQTTQRKNYICQSERHCSSCSRTRTLWAIPEQSSQPENQKFATLDNFFQDKRNGKKHGLTTTTSIRCLKFNFQTCLHIVQKHHKI